ncbi:hypothetical protein NDU88_003629 [Pleurodeles waltl]|uniref:Uncharacterized protein n=1 Tax=Pleurodeles waltl TaxID=8319 RepID=A0AAV7NKE2_PLEWA|nr:hypothetical protein NDU88_003629 [Pleurodeles waltl]
MLLNARTLGRFPRVRTVVNLKHEVQQTTGTVVFDGNENVTSRDINLDIRVEEEKCGETCREGRKNAEEPEDMEEREKPGNETPKMIKTGTPPSKTPGEETPSRRD